MTTVNDMSQLSDDDILEGFKNSDGKIVKEYFYGYCRVAYCVYDQRYDLRISPAWTSCPWLMSIISILAITSLSL